MSSKLNEEQNLRKVVESFYIILTTPDEVETYIDIMHSNSSDQCVHRYNNEILNLFDLELQLANTKPTVKNKLKELLSELKKLKFQTILVLDYKKKNNRKSFQLSAKLIAIDSNIDEPFKSMHQQSIMKKKKDFIHIKLL